MQGQNLRFMHFLELRAHATLYCRRVELSLQREGGGKGFIVGSELAEGLVCWVGFVDELKDAAGVLGLGGDGWGDGVEDVERYIDLYPF